MKTKDFLKSMVSDGSDVSSKRVVGVFLTILLAATVIVHLITGKIIQNEILYVIATTIGACFGFNAMIDAKALSGNKVLDNAVLKSIPKTEEPKEPEPIKVSKPVKEKEISNVVVQEPIEDADILDGLKENFKKPTNTMPIKPKNLLEAGSFYLGVSEVNGADSNKAILEFGKRADISWYNNDSIPWCAVFVNAMCDIIGLTETKSALAKSFLSWGKKITIDDAVKDSTNVIGIFHRGDKNSATGHVAILKDISLDKKYANMLGGNQGDKVSIQRFKLDDKFITFKRGIYI